MIAPLPPRAGGGQGAFGPGRPPCPDTPPPWTPGARCRYTALGGNGGSGVGVADNVTVLDHPLIQHKLSRLRDRATSTAGFRRLAREISLLMCYEVTRGLAVEYVPIDTPLEPMMAPTLAGKKLCFVSILRAGSGILEGMLDCVPSARVGHIGLYREPVTLQAVQYYQKLPEDIAERLVILVDPMLATGHSASAAVTRIKEAGATQIRFACLIAVPEGIATMRRDHPTIEIFTCAIDRALDEHGYIRPGLGDAGDRLFGTK